MPVISVFGSSRTRLQPAYPSDGASQRRRRLPPGHTKKAGAEKRHGRFLAPAEDSKRTTQSENRGPAAGPACGKETEEIPDFARAQAAPAFAPAVGSFLSECAFFSHTPPPGSRPPDHRRGRRSQTQHACLPARSAWESARHLRSFQRATA